MNYFQRKIYDELYIELFNMEQVWCSASRHINETTGTPAYVSFEVDGTVHTPQAM